MGAANVTTGLCQYVYYQLVDNVPTPFGLVTGGSVKDTGEVLHRHYIGGGDRMVGGIVVPSVSLSFLPVDGEIIATDLVGGAPDSSGLAWRATSGYPCTTLTELETHYGSGGEEVYAGGKINTMSLACGVGDPLSCQIDMMAMDKTEAGSPTTPPALVGAHFEWYQAACLVMEAEVALQSFTFSMSNSLRSWVDMDSATATAMRLPLRLIEDAETIRLDIRCGNKLPIADRGNLTDELKTTLKFKADLTNSLGDVVEISLTGMANASADHPLVVDGEVVYSYSFELKNNPRTWVLGVPTIYIQYTPAA